MEKRYGLDAIRYLHDVAGGAGNAIHGPASIPAKQRVAQLRAAVSTARRELARLEAQLEQLERPTKRPGMISRIFGRAMAQES